MPYFDYSKMQVKEVEIINKEPFDFVNAKLVVQCPFGTSFQVRVSCTSDKVVSFYIFSPLLCDDKDYKNQEMAYRCFDADKIKAALNNNGFEFSPKYLANWKP